MQLNEKQKLAIIFAYADLVGALQAHNLDDSSFHDWRGHKNTIEVIEEVFSFIVPDKNLYEATV